MLKIFQYTFIVFLSIMFLNGCSTSRRFAKKEKFYTPSNSLPIKVLLGNQSNYFTYLVESPLILYQDNKAIALVKNGNRLNFSINGGGSLNLVIADKSFHSNYFELKPASKESTIYYKGRRYYGFLIVKPDRNSVRIINRIPLEDYLKGVVPTEMPVGQGDDYLEALKAFAICARTYAINRMDKNNSYFDVYVDTRDQVYGGAGYEKELSDRAVDETNGLILTYDDNPAKVYYHSSCGGHTENAKLVFGVKDAPYLDGVKDGDPPNCSGAPNFKWEEKYNDNVFIQRLIAAGLTSNKNYSLKNVEVKSRDESGRVNDLEITLASENNNEKIIHINGNRIRSVIRTSDNSNILKSTLFNISFDGNIVTISGKGYGHGVGLCQWGAIHQSIEGKSYKSILSFYFPGTEVRKLK
ncbi:MAG: SpoIID/LytB domain-containing protein [Bacteroidetes bacterium]|nr:SpoIID/LytB domain-containing protein [Bacteroidota bacterium]